MIFAFATDDKTLTVFPDEKEAVAYCEGFDVFAGGWFFFGADGSPMEPLFSEPASKSGFVVSHGRYSLRPSKSGADNHLLALLPQIVAVQGEAPLNSVAAIEQRLTSLKPMQQNSRIS